MHPLKLWIVGVMVLLWGFSGCLIIVYYLSNDLGLMFAYMIKTLGYAFIVEYLQNYL